MSKKSIHIMWTDAETWCGIKQFIDFRLQTSKLKPPTCKRCLRSPFAGEYYESKELDERYGDLFDKYMDRFNVPVNRMTRKIATMLLEQAKQ